MRALQKERDDARAERKAAEKKLDKLRQEAPHKDKVKPLVEKLVEFFYYSQVRQREVGGEGTFTHHHSQS